MQKLENLTKEKSVILFDDDTHSSQLANSILTDLGYNVVEHNNIVDVIESIKINPPNVAIVSVDIKKSSFYKLLKQVLDAYDVPVVFAASEHDIDTVLNLKHNLNYPFVTKPYTHNNLEDTIHDAINKQNPHKSLNESNLVYEIAFKICPVPLVVIKDGVILNCNSIAASLLDGGEIQSIIGKNILDFISPEMHEIAQSRMAQIMSGSILKPMPYRILRPDGKELWLEVNSSIFYYRSQKTILCTLHNITKAKEYSDILHENQIRLFSLLKGLRLFLYITDINTYKIKFINEYTHNIFGNILGCKCYEVIMGADNPCKHCKHIDINQDGWERKEHHVVFFCKRVDKWFDCYILYTKWLDGSLVRMILGTDITENKQLAKEVVKKIKQLKQMVEKETDIRKQTEKMLEHQSKLASLGEVMGAIAHQWKQPLNYIALIIQDVQESFSRQELTEEKMTNAVHLTLQQIQFLSNTIDDFRSFVRMQPQDKRFDVFKAIHKIVSMFYAILKERHININLFGQKGECLINGNENDIKHLILNLINNAKDAICSSRRNGKMPIDEVGLIEITLEKSDKNITITVSDNGGGIPDDIINSVFAPYFTTKDEGTGIGLYICKNLVEKSFGGSIKVTNSNRGAVFTVKIPLRNDMLV